MFRFAALPLALLLFGNAAAQDGKASIRLLAFSRSGEELETLVTDTAGKAVIEKPVALPTEQLSPVRSVTVRSLVFRSPKDANKVLGKVTLPAGDEFILVFLPLAEGSATAYQINAVPMPGSSFGSGDYAFFNYSGKEVGCVIGKERLSVAQGKAAVYQAAKDPNGDAPRSIVCYSKAADGAWETRPFFSARLIIQEGVRNLVFICRHPVTDRIDFRGIADFVE